MITPLRRFPSPQPRSLELINGDHSETGWIYQPITDLECHGSESESRRSKASERCSSRTSTSDTRLITLDSLPRKL